MSPASKWVTVAGPTGITRTGCLVTTADKLYRCTFQGSINHRLVRYLSVELLKFWISNAGILGSWTIARIVPVIGAMYSTRRIDTCVGVGSSKILVQ